MGGRRDRAEPSAVRGPLGMPPPRYKNCPLHFTAADISRIQKDPGSRAGVLCSPGELVSPSTVLRGVFPMGCP